MAGGLDSGGSSGLGGLLYSNPNYNSAAIDPGTFSLMQSEAAKGQNNNADTYAANDLAGTAHHLDTTASQNRASALGGPSDANMQAALQGRAQRSMDMGLNQLQAQSKVAGVGQQANQLHSAFGDVAGLQKAMSAASEAQIQAHQNNQRTRNSIISGLFGAAGTAGGLIGGGAQSPASNGDLRDSSGSFGGASTDQWASFTGAPGG